MSDSVILMVSEADDVVICVTGNTKLQRALERVLSRPKGANVILFADSKGVQKLVSIAGLVNDKAKDYKNGETSEQPTLNQLNRFQDGKLYVYFDFSNNTKKQKSLTSTGWVHNQANV